MSVIPLKFLWNMVEFDVFGHRNMEFDMKASFLSNKLAEITQGKYGDFVYSYATILTYTQDMRFDWRGDDLPDHYKAIEIWWTMIQEGQDELDCFVYFCREVSNGVIYGWQKVFNSAYKMYIPPEERQPDVDEEGEPADPNYTAAKQSGGTESVSGSKSSAGAKRKKNSVSRKSGSLTTPSP